MKNNVDVDRRSLAIEKEKIEQLKSDLKIWEDHLLTNTQSLETKKTLLQEVNEKKLENIYKKVLRFKANKDDMQKVSLALKKTQENLDQMIDHILKHNKLLQRERIKLDSLLSSMVKQKEDLEEKREQVEAAVERVSKDREKVISMNNNVDTDLRRLAIEKKNVEQLRSDLNVWEDHLMTKTQSLKTKNKLLQEVNEKKPENIFKKVLEFEANKDDIQKVSLALKNSLKSLDPTIDHVLKQNKLLHGERIKLDSLLSSIMKQKEDLEEKRKHVEAALERVSNDKEKVISMKNNVYADRRSLAIEKEKMEQLQSYLKVWEDHLLTNTESLETKKRHLQVVNEKKLENLSKKVLKFEANKDDMQKVSLALKNTRASLDQTADQVLKHKLFQRERSKLDSLLSSMVKQKELEEKREHLEAAVERFSNVREKVISMKNYVDADRIRLAIEKEKLEQLRSDLKVWEYNLMTNRQSLETAKADLHGLHEKNLENIFMEGLKLEANKDGVDQVLLALKNTHSGFDQTTDRVLNHHKLLQRERIKLDVLLSCIVEKHEEENPNVKLLIEKEYLQNLKSMIKQQKECLLGSKDIFCKEILALHFIKFDMRREMVMLEKNIHMFKNKYSKVEITENDFRNCKVEIDTLLQGIKKESKSISELNVQVQIQIDDLQNGKYFQQQRKNVLFEANNDILQKLFANKDKRADKITQYNDLIQVCFDNLFSHILNQREAIGNQNITLKKLHAESRHFKKVLFRKNTIKDKKDKEYLTCLKTKEERKNTIVQKFNHDITTWKSWLGIRAPIQEKRHIENVSDDINSVQKQISPIQQSVKFEKEIMRERMQIRVQQSVPGVVECAKLGKATNAGEFLKSKLKRLNQSLYDNFQKIMHQLAHKNKYCLYLGKIMEDVCYGLEQKLLISGYYKLIEQKTTHLLMTKSNKGIQTEVPLKEFRKIYENINKEHNKSVLQNTTVKQTERFETKCLEEDKHHNITSQFMESEREYRLIVSVSDKVGKEQKQGVYTQPESFVKKGFPTVNNISKRDCMRKIWKDTNVQKKEINQMKYTGHEMKKHLEKQLKVITNFVKTYWIHKKNTFVEKKTLDQGFGKIWGSNSEINHKIQDKKYFHLEKLKVEILCDIETLTVKKENRSRALNTCSSNTQLDMSVENHSR
ncbi:cytadherence high molecular weight protein 2-like [Phycodurus eques]|uniref:cytadherence high molecular weight protein 2-like n=1 Tax=Phycodurus eques TaxID=693459 RepID=UPI002ACD3A9D|nr:cytadherence high molecular weight protein 2-like [Phycodurus eques]